MKKADYLYKSVRFKDGILDFEMNDFIGDGDNGKFFAKKFGGFIAFMHLVLTKNEGAYGSDGVASLLNRINESTQSYTSLGSDYTKLLNKYFQSFGYSFDNVGFVPGWLYQIKSTVKGKLILADNAFTQNQKELKKLEPGELYAQKEFHWKNTFMGDTYDPFIKKLKEQDTEPKDEQNVSEINEKFIAHIFNAIQQSPQNPI